jgi:branched-chain amino acid transport system substrate-binding protein
LGVLSLVGASLALLAASASAQQPAIKIGLVGPFSGGSADFGTSMKRGAELAIKEINDLGGYVGRKFEVVVKDDKSTPDGALAAAQELIKEGVVATIGFCNTGNAMKALDEFQKNKVPLLVPCATGSPITKKYPTAESYIFQSSATDNLQVPFVVNDAVKRGWTKIAIFADTSGYGEAGFNDFMAALEAHKLKPAYV